MKEIIKQRRLKQLVKSTAKKKRRLYEKIFNRGYDVFSLSVGQFFG